MGSGKRSPQELLRDASVVLLDTSTLTMRGLSAKVDAGGHSGGNIIKEYDEGTKVGHTPRTAAQLNRICMLSGLLFCSPCQSRFSNISGTSHIQLMHSPCLSDLVQVVLKRPLRDVQQQLPVSEVAISLPSIKASLSDTEYALITSVAGANFSEALHISDQAR